MPYRGRVIYQHLPLDAELLQKIAKTTGGQYFHAADSDTLQQIYRTIDKLETTEKKQKIYHEYQELYAYLLWPAPAAVPARTPTSLDPLTETAMTFAAEQNLLYLWLLPPLLYLFYLAHRLLHKRLQRFASQQNLARLYRPLAWPRLRYMLLALSFMLLILALAQTPLRF